MAKIEFGAFEHEEKHTPFISISVTDDDDGETHTVNFIADHSAKTKDEAIKFCRATFDILCNPEGRSNLKSYIDDEEIN